MMRRMLSDNRNLRIVARSFSLMICAAAALYHARQYGAGARDARTILALADSAAFALFFLIDTLLLVRGHARRWAMLRGLVYLGSGAAVMGATAFAQMRGALAMPMLPGLFYALGAGAAGAGLWVLARTPDRPSSQWIARLNEIRTRLRQALRRWAA